MKRSPRRQRLVAEINITPFTDVILVLLVIFMITTPLITELGIKVKLPQVQSGQPIERAAQGQVNITITAEGAIYLNSRVVTRKELIERMRALCKDNLSIGVILRADRLVRFKDIIGILDPLTGLGITKFQIAGTNEP